MSVSSDDARRALESVETAQGLIDMGAGATEEATGFLRPLVTGQPAVPVTPVITVTQLAEGISRARAVWMDPGRAASQGKASALFMARLLVSMAGLPDEMFAADIRAAIRGHLTAASLREKAAAWYQEQHGVPASPATESEGASA